MKRLSVLLLTIALMFSSAVPTYACDESQTNTYVKQVLFGDQASQYESDENIKMLLNALFLCSEQHDNLGQDKLTQLKDKRVGMLPTLSGINVSGDSLLDCAHNSWEYEFVGDKKAQANRKKTLQRTVNKVFDFGVINNIFCSGSGKCNSFSALLYYTHILSDYLADDPNVTETNVHGKSVSSYTGQPYIELNCNIPSFTNSQKKNTASFAQFSSFDSLGRCGVAFANISTDNMAPSGSRQKIGSIIPTGWTIVRYPGIVNSEPPYLYNRCHLIAHQLNGNDTAANLITGTRYLNVSGMNPFERKVANYIQSMGNHVLYRATPIFEGDNLVASGVQLEAYSVEDAGKGICFNVYCYNVQPGVSINYANGLNEISDETYDADNMIPFAVSNPSDSNPDLIYEVNKHLAILFGTQKSSFNYTSMMNQINEIANNARVVGDKGESEAQRYIKLKGYEYEYFNTLKTYIPLLLQNEDFFNSTFK
ncbi:MAG: DNA/RNA non-specific endonuclease [Sedimentibacter sp.]|uniref:DNA/RNA non-specific endonuclease n=1 Tax=Sedimentibacter sp. TaxID=1960295 RepID=UPI002980E0B0|nr:DNA/RNA non-specific endonuclease [Sedimentibacter sp.]MDW5299586.1 DNA/RNA non-specific endonuclease [Sedimentibacter sp.]